jgi:hypothetical protein
MDDLIALMAPPKRPLEVPTASDWEQVERQLGRVPTDYRQFVTTYGTGTVDQFLWIFNPATGNPHLELRAAGTQHLEALRQTKQEFPPEFDVPLHPEPGGLLPFGLSDNGDILYWRAAGEPDTWRVCVMGPRAPETFDFDGCAVEFLTAVLSGEVVCDRFPGDFPDEPPIEFVAKIG